jgi:PAS domain S-box-containing protein
MNDLFVSGNTDSHPDDLEFLSRTATEFVEMSGSVNIYDYIGARLAQIAGDIPVIIVSFEKESGTFTVRSIQGAPRVVEAFIHHVGRTPVGKAFHLSPAAAESLFERKLKSLPVDLYEMTERTVPEFVCRAAEKLMNLESVFAMGFTRETDLLGSASFYLPKGRTLERRNIIETFINQASVALQRRRSEEALRRSVSLLTATLESTADGLLVVDSAGRISSYNRQFASMWGLPEDTLRTGKDEEAINQILSRLRHPDSFLARVKELYENPDETSFDVIEFRDGRIFERYSQPQRIDGKPVGRVWSFRDVTERKNAEAALKKSEQHHRQVVEGLPEVIFETDSAGLWTLLNPAWTEITGFSPEESLGTPFLNFIHPEDRQRTLEFFRPLIQRETDFCRHEIRYLTKDGGFKWVEVHSTLIVDDNDLTVGTTGTLRDITEQKRDAENLQKLYSQTEQDARTKAELLNEVNHRVKNNLMAVQGLLLAERRLADPAGRPYVERAIDSISGRIDGLLSVHRMLSASQWGPMRISDLAETIISRLLSGGHNGCQVSLEVEPSPIEVSPRQASSLALVINELATNTVKHALQGRESALVSVRACAEGEDIRIEYRDDGPGYPVHVLRRERPTVGMRLVHQLVAETLRGRLELASESGAVAIMHIKVEEKERT